VPAYRLSDEYSEDLDNSVFNCVTEEMEERPYAFRLVEFIRKGKERAKRRGRVRFEALPAWAFEQKSRLESGSPALEWPVCYWGSLCGRYRVHFIASNDSGLYYSNPAPSEDIVALYETRVLIIHPHSLFHTTYRAMDISTCE